MLQKFKQRWNISSNYQVIIILIVFAITGSLSAYLSKPFLSFLGITKGTVNIYLYYFLYIFLVLPIYKVLLFIIGSIFGQQVFFANFIKKMLLRMKLNYIAKALDKFC